jgi:hypothetical protein
MSSDIPWARKVLRQQIEGLRRALGPDVTGPERERAVKDAIMLVENALAHMTRETVKPRRAKVESDVLTPELADDIRRYLEENPGASVKHVAALFHVNQGRVTEALQGKV